MINRLQLWFPQFFSRMTLEKMIAINMEMLQKDCDRADRVIVMARNQAEYTIMMHSFEKHMASAAIDAMVSWRKVNNENLF